MRSPPSSYGQVRRRVFIPIGLAVVTMLAIACVSVFWHESRAVRQKLIARLGNVARYFQSELEESTELMSALADCVERDAEIRDAYLTGDRQRLLKAALPHFKRISSKYRTTHLYFHDLKEVCFLRVHNPSQFGDKIERFTLAEAVKTGITVPGLELGPFGTFTLRLVRPWRVNGRLIGYIEMGQGIEHVPAELKSILDADILFAINKSFLDRDTWEEGVRMTGQTGQWNLAEEFVIVDRTMKEIPRPILEFLNDPSRKDGDKPFAFSGGSRSYRCGVLRLQEAGGRDVGSLFALIDTTRSAEALNRLLAFLIGSGTTVAGALCLFFWNYLGRIQRQLVRGQEELETALERERCFAADVAHELRTPLAGMRSTIDVACLRKRSSGELRESLDDCSGIVHGMESLVDRLLLLARIGSKRTAAHHTTFALSPLVEHCWKPLWKKVESRQLIFENHIPDDIQCVSDRDSLTIVFSNLLQNSVEYTDHQGKIWVRAGEDSQGNLLVEVANTGCQLDATQARMTLHPFWRADTSRKSEGEHAGLGLALVRRLVAELEGDVSIDVGVKGIFSVHLILPKIPAT